MTTELAPPERTYRHVVEQPTLRRVVEHFTVLTLLLAVSLYAIGQFESWRYISSFGIPSTGVERGWETYVFTGAVALINLVLSPSLNSLRWLLPMGFLGGLWMLRARIARREPGRLRGFALPALTGLFVSAYVGLLIMLGLAWGLQNASHIRDFPSPPQRFVVTAEAQAGLPQAFLDANAKGALRFVASGADSVFLYDPGSRRTYALPTRFIVCRIFEPQD